jgi:hypothetical protein
MYPVEQALRSTTPSMSTEIRIKGKDISVPSAQIDGKTVIATGNWFKKAAVHDEELLEGEAIVDPESFIARLKQSGLNTDLFTFAQQLPDITPRFTYHLEWDNLAVIPITTYSHWWKKQAESSVQRAVRKAAKLGVVVKRANLDDTFVNGIVGINNETPIRQGMAFWHYKKSSDAVRRENSTYADRNIFVAAYYRDELIGFMRITYVGKVAHILQILTMMQHFDKRPANALIAKAVEVCEQEGMTHLTYCNYTYKDPKSTLTEFKRRNGFEKVLLPRYYVPLTRKGRMALRLGFHHGLAAQIPKPLVRQLLKIRSFWYGLRSKTVKETF